MKNPQTEYLERITGFDVVVKNGNNGHGDSYLFRLKTNKSIMVGRINTFKKARAFAKGVEVGRKIFK